MGGLRRLRNVASAREASRWATPEPSDDERLAESGPPEGWGHCPPELRLWRILADQGDAYAQCSLGFLYDHGRVVRQDCELAVFWYRKAADQANALGQFNLGALYDLGRGVVLSHELAAIWYRKAAVQGYAAAQYNLGAMYANGEGVPRNPSEAAVWLRRAANRGNANARYSLGVMYANGEGVPRDCAQAHLWFSLAVAGFPETRAKERVMAAQNRDIIAALMTPAEVAGARRLARDWAPESVAGDFWPRHASVIDGTRRESSTPMALSRRRRA